MIWRFRIGVFNIQHMEIAYKDITAYLDRHGTVELGEAF